MQLDPRSRPRLRRAGLEPRTCGPDVDQVAGWIEMCQARTSATYGLPKP